MKRCIFYLPYKLDDYGMGARMIRPRKMIQAFREIGYEVYVITGVSSDRKRLIKEIKHRIIDGEQYDFMYTESHTEPTLLTDPHHLPTHPFLDYGFFRFVHEHGIKIGLFYCDIYWKFELYGKNLPLWKKFGALICYRYDVIEYKKFLNRFYIPDLKICTYLKEDLLSTIAEELPPGADDLDVEGRIYEGRDFATDPLTIFYVGGVGKQYQIVELLKAVYQTSNLRLILCCRKEEWEKERGELEDYLCDKITIIHKNSGELEQYYREADICSLLFKNDEYREMAKPFKAYEYLAHEIPVLSTKGTAIGSFVEDNGIGWNIEFDASAISGVLKTLLENPAALERMKERCRTVKKRNLWVNRAEQVVKGLVE